VGRVFVKDESDRMGLPAFKVLGASWAVHQVLSRRQGDGELTLVTATDGNHGRAVARMARLFGQRAHVFVPGGVHPTAVAAIAAEGAQVTEIAGTYDEAVLLAAEAASRPGANSCRMSAGPATSRCRPGSSRATRPCSPRLMCSFPRRAWPSPP
jgi:diaminopropionate ammonia-lyase